MADEQYRWLNRETAERLLNGESPEAAGPAGNDQAERLARALGALSAPPPPAGGELPGEAAALAAFREAREERTDRAAEAVPVGPRAGAARGADVGLVRIGVPPADRSGAGRTSRRTRSVRFGLAAALAAGMVGGAAVLAGTGVLPAPSGVFGPATTTTATGPPERPPAPRPSEKGAPGGATPDDGPDGQDGPPGNADGGTGRRDGPGAGAGEDGGPAETGVDTGGLATGDGRGKQIVSACRALRDGRALPGDRRRLLEGAAGGPGRVGPYCENVLARHGTGTGPGSAPDPGPGSGATAWRDGGHGNGHGRGDHGNGNGGNGNGGNGNGGNGNGNGGRGNGGNGKGNADDDEGNGGGGQGRQGNGKGGGGNDGKPGRGGAGGPG
ncbi:hypothetical protein [Streptomyces prasinopilosus]|uniref:Uncharacterized protein n=1 Tax=Streptomyces prasinopilosus TaxID=67344 RepID=A0A1G6NWA8_9ACTN|nr:hypothetical protein [Streptomyces prasinopilosus]SDC72038.1 hypothetical protein SAMN05216505_103284 [Streptomyces prasinopilosus]